MIKRIFMLLLAGTAFKMLNRRNRGFALRRNAGGWGSRHDLLRNRGPMDIFGRRRRSII
ncbi:MAG TPA: hypothetical protein VJ385_22555 [Fibrobacteria bacterium]|nr:hypothetical protein [Fibrobacteria bacterium]